MLLSSAWSRMEWPKPRTLPHTLTCSTRTSPRLCVTPRRPCANAGCRSLSREISCRQCLISNPRRAAAPERIRCRPCTRLPPPTADDGQVFEREKRRPHRYLRGYRFRHAPCADPGARTFSDPVPTGPRQRARASGGSAASQSGGPRTGRCNADASRCLKLREFASDYFRSEVRNKRRRRRSVENPAGHGPVNACFSASGKKRLASGGSALRSAIPFWISTAQRIASTTLGNSDGPAGCDRHRRAAPWGGAMPLGLARELPVSLFIILCSVAAGDEIVAHAVAQAGGAGGDVAAVDGDFGAADEARFGGRQKQHQIGAFLGRAVAVQRDRHPRGVGKGLAGGTVK